MKKILFIVAILVIGAFSNAATEKVNIGKQSSLGLLWMQDGAEYKSLVYQAFNIATKEIKDEKDMKKVFVRIDDVLLDNTPYFAWLLAKNEKDTNENRNRWYKSLDAEAVEGAVDFVNSLESGDIELSFVTSRDQSVYKATVKNMKKAGFEKVKTENIISTDEFSSYIKKGGEYTVIVTNDLNELTDKLENSNYMARNKFADEKKKSFGEKWVIIPNVLYGNFETSLSKNYEISNSNQKSEVRKNTLNDWEGTKQFDRNIFDF